MSYLIFDKRGNLKRLNSDQIVELLHLSESVFAGLAADKDCFLYKKLQSIFVKIYPDIDDNFWIDHKNSEIIANAKIEADRKAKLN